MTKIILTVAMLIASYSIQAQVGVGTTTPHDSAILDLSSTTKGFLKPRMNTGNRTAISLPAIGLEVFDTDTNTGWCYTGTVWVDTGVNTGDTTIDAFINNVANTRIELATNANGTTARTAGTEFVIKDDGKVGIGITVPTEKLDLAGSINLATAIKIAGSAGANGQALMSNGTNTSWETPTLAGDVTGLATATAIMATSNGTLTTLSGLTTATNLVKVGTITTGTWNGTSTNGADFLDPLGTSWAIPVGTSANTIYKITLIGGGGGSGGMTGNVTAGGGGGGGVVVLWAKGIAATSLTYAIGAGGITGTATSSGGSGGSTTITLGSNVYTAGGGTGGTGGAYTGTMALGGTGVAPALFTTAPVFKGINIVGQSGSQNQNAIGVPSFGGSSGLGYGIGGFGFVVTASAPAVLNANGVVGTGFGAGASGGKGTATATALGAVGTVGAIIIEWQN